MALEILSYFLIKLLYQKLNNVVANKSNQMKELSQTTLLNLVILNAQFC